MKAGKRSHRFAFDKRKTESDGAGNTIGAWEQQFVTWASRLDLRGGENVMAARLEGRKPVVIGVLRETRTVAVTTDWRCRDARTGETFNIRSIQPGEKRDMIEFLCEAGVAHG
jgi:head-tail adaptor